MSAKLQNSVREYNEIELKDRENLPNFLEAIKEAQNGNGMIIRKFFYGQRVIERHSYDGKKENYVVNKVKFWDKPLDIFLRNIKKKYTKVQDSGEQSGFDGRKISFKYSIANFEESEIDELFFTYILALVDKIDLVKFDKGSEAKTLNAIRKYIRVDFENNYLRKELNNRIQLERVQVDGQTYWVKTKPEEVFFEDIYVGQNEEGEKVHFLDIVKADTVSMEEADFMLTSKKFIEENLEDGLTRMQLEKWNMLVEYVKEHGIDSLLDKHTGKIIKAKIQRVVYPDKNKKNSDLAELFITNVNNRMEKLLDDAGMKYVSRDEENAKLNQKKEKKSGNVEVFTGGMSEEEVEGYFQKHLEFILKAITDGRLVFDRGTDSMLPSLDSLNEIPFDVYEVFVKATKKEKLAIIEEYHNPDKFKLRAGKKEIKKVTVGKEFVEKNDNYITPDQLREIRRKSEINKRNNQ